MKNNFFVIATYIIFRARKAKRIISRKFELDFSEKKELDLD